MSNISASKTCNQCDKIIDSQTQTFLLVGKDQLPYHKSCLCCMKCQKPIDSNCAKKDGKMYHPECYAPGQFDLCNLCGKAITGKHIQAGESLIHLECYSCQFCQNIVNKEFYLISNKPACNNCWEKQAPPCFVCNKRIVGKRFSANEKYTFHPECYKCNHCDSDIIRGSFIPFEHNVYHSECFKKTDFYIDINKRKTKIGKEHQ